MTTPIAYLRDAQPDAEDEALVVCAKGDPGAFPVYAADGPETLVSALEAALAWIDAVPPTLALPAMPGFDRDEADELIFAVRCAALSPEGH